jgi:hypothetical protein
MKQRSFYEEIWRDDRFVALSRASKLVAIYCFTNPNIKLVKAFRLTDREIIFDTGINSDELTTAKKELTKLNIYLVDNYCVLNSEYGVFNFKGEKLQAAIEKQLSELPENIVLLMKSDRVSIGYVYPTDRTNDNDNDNENKGVQGDKYKKFIDHFNKITNRKFGYTDKKARNQFEYLRKSYEPKDFEHVIRACLNDTYHRDNGYKYMTPEFITRTDIFERYLNVGIPNQPKEAEVEISPDEWHKKLKTI